METPEITTSMYCSSSGSPSWISLSPEQDDKFERLLDASSTFVRRIAEPHTQTTEETNMPNANRRVVQVFIADPNDNVPLEHSVLFKGDQKLTDLTDTELFFEVPMAENSQTKKPASGLGKTFSLIP